MHLKGMIATIAAENVLRNVELFSYRQMNVGASPRPGPCTPSPGRGTHLRQAEQTVELITFFQQEHPDHPF